VRITACDSASAPVNLITSLPPPNTRTASKRWSSNASSWLAIPANLAPSLARLTIRTRGWSFAIRPAKLCAGEDAPVPTPVLSPTASSVASGCVGETSNGSLSRAISALSEDAERFDQRFALL